MNENVILLFCYIPGPVTFLIVGLLLWKLPSPYGDAIGYKTKLSYSSKEAWDYAQVTFGRLCTLSSVPVLAISVGMGAFQVIRNTDDLLNTILSGSVWILQLVPVFACIFITESRLKKYFGIKK